MLKENDISLTRKDKRELSLFLAFLPRRNKSMRENYINNEDFMSNLENEMKQLNKILDHPLSDYFPSPMNTILQYTMTIWESDILFPLFPENMGISEFGWESSKMANGEEGKDCSIDRTPDTLMFPISKNRVLIFYNQKYRMDRIFLKNGLSPSQINALSSKDGGEIVLNYINEKLCDRSKFLRFNIFKFNQGSSKIEWKNLGKKDLISEI